MKKGIEQDQIDSRGGKMTDKKKPGRPSGSKHTSSSTAKKKNSSGAGSAGRGQAKTGSKGGSRLRDEIWSIIIIAVGAFFVVALHTHAAGKFGIVLSTFLKGCFGAIANVLPYYLIIYGILVLLKRTSHLNVRSIVSLVLIFLSMTLINSAGYLHANPTFKMSFTYIADMYKQGTHMGGAFGMSAGLLLVKGIGITGLCIFAGVLMLICILLVINTPVSQFFDSWKSRRVARALLELEEVEDFDPNAEAEAMLAAARLARKPEKKSKSAQKLGVAAALKGEPLFFAPEPPVRRGITPGQMKILDYMKDDQLFEKQEDLENEETPDGSSDIFGMEPINAAASGVGSTGAEGAIFTKGIEGVIGIDVDEGMAGLSAIAKAAATASVPRDEIAITTLADLGLESESKAASEDLAWSEASHSYTTDVPISGLSFDEPTYEENKESEDEIKTIKPNETEPEQMQEAMVLTAHDKEGTMVAGIPGGVIQKQGQAAALKTGEEKPHPVVPAKPYQFPPIELLGKGPAITSSKDEKELLKAKAEKLEETLKNFGVNARIVQVTKGPSVTRYEIQPSTGVKVNSIVRLADDIALNLEAKSIRIEAPIPGKAAVGIEVENDRVNMVALREIVESKEFNNAKSKISFAVGKDISGNPVVADLKGMPHMLIAGSTGSGKSVCINSLIISMLYKAKPDEVKFVLIDPKVVELNNYNGIPHLLIPVVTDPSKAAAALNWAVTEMMDRYKKFAETGARNLEGYNDWAKENDPSLVLPQIVIVIDELADLMMAAPSQVEESICRLAQLARAAGMHLIVATQRPSVDIITGVIKANIPSRIAFAVSSQVDSRTILDMGGAEKLVGKGDMLFSPQGESKPSRVQGAFISDSEVHKVIEFLKVQMPGNEYATDVLHSIEKVNVSPKEEDGDELLQEAIEIVVKAEQASVSMLQRRFRVGYNRAARLIDMMEARGIVGPYDGSRPRKVLITQEELDELAADEEGVPEELF